MGLVFRAFYAQMPMRFQSKSGIPTKVPYLFATMLRRLLATHQPDYLAAVFDVSGPTFRDALFEEYKAQRPAMPEDLAIQLPHVRRLCEAMRLPVVTLQGYEADDLIGALAHQAAAESLDVLIVSGDKDMLQLVRTASSGATIRVLRPASGAKDDRMVDEPAVEEILGVPPEKVPEVMALMGDNIDNIPGAKGIGEKGARELILQFGTAEAALDRAAEVKSKRYREALQNCRDAVLLSKKLATIAYDAPLSLDLHALARRDPDLEALRSLYVELDFTSLLKELSALAPPAPVNSAATAAAGATAAEEIASPSELSAFLDSLPADEGVAHWLALAADDSESEGFHSRIASVEISPSPGSSRFFRVEAPTGLLDALASPATSAAESRGFESLKVFSSWLASSRQPKILHDPKLFTLLVGPVSNLRHATILYSYLLQPTTAKHALSDSLLRRGGVTLSDAPGECAESLHSLAAALRTEVESQGLLDLYTTMDLPLATVLARMERHGVRLDPASLAALSAALEAEIRTREGRIYELAGQGFNINSPKQLAEILFDKLNLQVPGRRGRGPERSTAAAVLEELAHIHPLPAEIIEYREIAKLKSTYADALPRLMHPSTGRIHTSLSQTATATGRLSSSNPNLQNIPVRTELGRQIRAAFVPEPGWVFLSADYSQIELRLLAHFSEDPALMDAFQRGQDIHARTAEEVFGVGPLIQTAEHRRAAKAINFGIVYGQTPFGLAQQLGVDQKEAARFIAAYFERYAGVRKWLDAQVAATRREGFTRTLHGRTRPIPEMNSSQPALRNFAERTAVNTPLQGTAADLIKLAMIEIDRRLAEHNLRSRMILQVHDELLFECPPEEFEVLCGLVKPAMEQVHALKVPLVVDLKSGPNWRDMK